MHFIIVHQKTVFDQEYFLFLIFQICYVVRKKILLLQYGNVKTSCYSIRVESLLNKLEIKLKTVEINEIRCI